MVKAASGRSAPRARPSAKKAAQAPTKKAVNAVRASAPKKGMKTQVTDAPVAAFLATLAASTRADCERIAGLMRAATGTEGVMYGTAIVGFGSSVIRYTDGRESPWMKMGFAPRKQAIVLYGVVERAPAALLAKLGKHETGKGCLYLKRLADVDTSVLEEIIGAAARA